MREIKFRAWDEKKKVMRNVNEINFSIKSVQCEPKDGIDSNLEMYDPILFVGKYKLMQYTGLKDKNGVGIYEGDIHQEEYGDLSVIVFLEKAGSYCVMPLDIYLNDDYQDANFFPEFFYSFGYDCTFDNQIPEKYLNIVGNIYENPELLEVQNG